MSFLRGSKSFAEPLLRFALILGCLLPAFGSAGPGTISVAWNRNTESNVSGYKIYWGETARHYTKVLDAGNAVEARLTELTSGQTYFCAVTAYNTAGQESAYSSEISVTYVAEPGAQDSSSRLVLLEAENGQRGSPMSIFTEAGVSYVATSTYSTSAWVELGFTAPVEDNYHVWCRVKSPTSSTDSFGVAVDSGTEDIFHVYGAPEPADGIRSSSWIWKKIHLPNAGPKVYALSAATHTIRFRSREPGAQLDRIVLTNDPNFIPDDSLPRSGDVLAVTEPPASLVRNQGQSAVFTVTAAATGPVSYQWKKNGVALSGANSASLILGSLGTGDAGHYSVDVINGTVSATAGPAFLTVNSAVPQPVFRVSRMTLNPDRSLAFHLEGELDTNILVYASSNLTTWSLIAVHYNETGLITVSDPGAAGKTQRFYRLESESMSPFGESESDRTPTPGGATTKALNVSPEP